MIRTFALISEGTVVNAVLSATQPPNAIDITDLSPRPGPGWTYDGQTFAPPPPVEPEPAKRIRLITRRSFLARLSVTENRGYRKAIAKLYQESATEAERNLAADLEGLDDQVKFGPYVDLDHPRTTYGVNAMAALGLLDSPQRVAALLADGTADEEYRPV